MTTSLVVTLLAERSPAELGGIREKARDDLARVRVELEQVEAALALQAWASRPHRSRGGRKQGYYGYKVHAAVDVATDLPLAWTVETASRAEQTFALGLLDAARERGFGIKTAIMDAGYDSEPIHGVGRGILPVTSLRETPAVKRGEHKPPCCRHGIWTFAGADFKRRATKWRCPTGECQPREHLDQGVAPAPIDPRARASAAATSTAHADPWSESSGASRTNGRWPRCGCGGSSACACTSI
jgi:hypothetical protein